MAKVFFSPAAEKDLKHFSRQAQEEVKNCLALLGSDPLSGKPLHGPLRGFFVYRFTVDGASYRIAYEVVDRNVIVLMVGNRDNFYKKFGRRAQ